MSVSGQRVTKTTYNDPTIVATYISKHAIDPYSKLSGVLSDFSETIPGKRVLDLGCGPGHDSYLFASLGFHVTGIDYAETMIAAAQTFQDVLEQPTFVVGDMRELSALFAPDTFDGVWASASLLHIPIDETAGVLQGIHTVTKKNGRIYISVKSGKTGEIVVEEDKYGKQMKREFTFWEKDTLEKMLMTNGFRIDRFLENNHASDPTTSWLTFYLSVMKNSPD